MKISIRYKIVLSFLFVITLLFISQMIFNVYFAESYYIDSKSNFMEKAYDEIQENYSSSADVLEAITTEYENSHNLAIIIREGYNVVYTTFDRQLGNTDAMHEPNVMRPEYYPDDYEYKQSPTAEIVAPGSEMEMLRYLGMFEYEGETIYVSLSLPMASIQQSTEIFSSASMVISIVALIIGFLISILLATSITKPITDVEKLAAKLSKQDFTSTANENVSSLELSSLAQSINKMSSQLEQAIYDLNDANEKLKADVDQQKKMDELRREFIGNVSHEMKTPLALLQIYASNLKTDVPGIDKEYYCDTIIEETDRLSEMVSSMLDISSIESGLSKMDLADMSLSDMTNGLISKITPMLEDYTVTTKITPDINISGDGKYLEQAMKNYVNNAVEHTDVGKKIDITLELCGERAIYKVRNEGVNIADEHIAQIWDSFYRMDKARVRSGNNVGLGLHIVKTIIDKHGGSCSVKNEENAVVFSFELPTI